MNNVLNLEGRSTDKKRAATLLNLARVQFPGNFQQDGYIHNINDNDSPVNKKLGSQTETTQFKHWFKKGAAVDSNGLPLLVE